MDDGVDGGRKGWARAFFSGKESGEDAGGGFVVGGGMVVERTFFVEDCWGLRGGDDCGRGGRFEREAREDGFDNIHGAGELA